MTITISEQDFEQSVLNAWPQARWAGLTVLVACSGGADSVALLRCLVRLASDATTIKVAHYNHQLRGEDSRADEQFVCSLSDSLQLQCVVGNSNTVASVKASADILQCGEDDLRDVRYAFLEDTANRLGARYIVTAHTADDQAETILHRLCRGTGGSGMRGIRPFRELGADLVVARPMLSIWREEVLAYLEALAQPFRFDCSNSSNRYTRNRIRNEILPELEKSIHPNAKRNMVEASKNFSELYSLVDTQACDFRDRWVARIGYETIIPTIPLAELHSALRKEVLRQIWFVESWPIADMSHQHWTLLSEMVVGQASLSGDKPFVQSFPGDVMVRIDAERVSLKRKGDSNA